MQIMVDIETLGIKSFDSLIWQIGAVAFDWESEVIHEEFSVTINIEQASGDIEASTLAFWLREMKSWSGLIESLLGVSERQALASFEIFYRRNTSFDKFDRPITKCWAKGNTFDCILLQHAFKRIGWSAPWSFRDTRDMRTLIHVYETVCGQAATSIEPRFVGTKHNALDDARHQAKWSIAMMRRIRAAQ